MLESQTCLLQLHCLYYLLAFNRTSQILVFNEYTLYLNIMAYAINLMNNRATFPALKIRLPKV